MMKYEINDVVKFKVDENQLIGTVKAYNVDALGKKYILSAGDSMYEGITENLIVCKYVEYKRRVRAPKEQQ